MNSSTPLKEFAERIRDSDREAFGELFRLLRNPLVRYVVNIVREDMVAHDLVQDSFVSLWKLRESLDPSRSIKAYLYQIARNRAIRHLRDTRNHAEKHNIIKRESSGEIPEEEWPDAAIEKESMKEKLKSWLRALPERQREALELSRYQGLSHREIAEVMEISPRTVNTHITLAIKNLQKNILNAEPALLNV